MSVSTLLSPSRLRGPLASAPYRLLVTGSTVNALGNAITPVALAFGVLELGGSASELGLVVAAYALAEVVTAAVRRGAGGPAAAPGAHAGRRRRRRGHPGRDRRRADRRLGDR